MRNRLQSSGVRGIAVALTEGSKVRFVGTWGERNAAGAPLEPQTIMYGASLTKAVFAYTVMQLVDEGRLSLDTPLATYLPKPLPEYTEAEDDYSAWQHLAGDERWRKLTARMLLNHTSGFHNFYWLEADKRLQFHFEPGTRYSYSGDGIILLQFVLEKGLGLSVGDEMQRRVFAPFGMSRTSLKWRSDFAANSAEGWDEAGKAFEHDQRSRVRAAGSMDTTIADMARFSAAVHTRHPGWLRAMFGPGLPITTASQFPVLQPDAPRDQQISGLAAGLGVVTFKGPQGPGFFKGGHNDTTGNVWVCLERSQRCVVILANDVRAEALFPGIVERLIGKTGLPWQWEYGVKPWTKL